jgi:hypothetical protein
MKRRKGFQILMTGLLAGILLAGQWIAAAAHVNPCQDPETVTITGHAEDAGNTVEMHLFSDLSHDWPLIFPELPEAKDTYSLTASIANKNMEP